MANNKKPYPRGLRNCNPGNIRNSRTTYKGEVVPSQDTAFKQLRSMAYGYRAMFVLIRYYYKRLGLKTIRQIINRYAPPIENNTSSYIQRVCEGTLYSPDMEIPLGDRDFMVLMVASMSKVENGVPPMPGDTLVPPASRRLLLARGTNEGNTI